MRILIISDYIAPLASIASIRWTKLGKYLARQGHSVDILTAEHSYSQDYLDAPLWDYDKLLAKDLPLFSRNLVIKNGFLSRKIYRIVNKKRIAKFEDNKASEVQANSNTGKKRKPIVSNTAVMVVASLFVYFNAIRQYPRIAHEYDVAISTFAPYWTHMLGKKLKKKNDRLIWLADYRDAPACRVFGASWYNRTFPQRCTQLANTITTVTESMWPQLRMDDNHSHTLIQNGFDPEEAVSRIRVTSDTFDLVYTGTLYSVPGAKSDLLPLFEAVDSLIENGEVDPRKIQILYAGRNGNEFLTQAVHYPNLPSKNLGLIPRNDALKLQNKASALLLCCWNTHTERGVATGKIYEYLSSDVPIIGLCSGDVAASLAKEMIEQSNAGFCYEEANTEQDMELLKQFILDKYHQWISDGITSYVKNSTYVDQFNYSNLAARINNLIQLLDEER